MRAVSGDKTAFAYSDDISPDGARQAAAAATRAIAQAGAGKREDQVGAALSRRRRPRPLPAARSARTRSMPPKGGAARARREDGARRDPRVVQVMAGLAGEYDVVLVARSDGVLAADVRPLVRVSVR